MGVGTCGGARVSTTVLLVMVMGGAKIATDQTRRREVSLSRSPAETEALQIAALRPFVVDFCPNRETPPKAEGCRRYPLCLLSAKRQPVSGAVVAGLRSSGTVESAEPDDFRMEGAGTVAFNTKRAVILDVARLIQKTAAEAEFWVTSYATIVDGHGCGGTIRKTQENGWQVDQETVLCTL